MQIKAELFGKNYLYSNFRPYCLCRRLHIYMLSSTSCPLLGRLGRPSSEILKIVVPCGERPTCIYNDCSIDKRASRPRVHAWASPRIGREPRCSLSNI